MIADAWPGVPPAAIAPVRNLTYKAGDGLEIPAYLTLPVGREAKNLPLIVLPHGGPEARDEPGFDWWAQALASRGYAVLQPQFRGSAGFGRKFVEAGHGQWGRKMQSDLSEGVRHLAKEGIVDSKRVCIMGASYGGYAALAGATLEPDVYRCAVSVAGVSDLPVMLKDEVRSAGGVNRTGVRYWAKFMGTSFQKRGELDAVSPAAQAARAGGPILLIHGKDDTVVPFEQSEIMHRALKRAGKPVEFVTLAAEDHWLSRGATRLEMLKRAVSFVEKHNPPN
jgi:dipeptidyl aminopeptidase/acylaminoacyl peptidase